MAPRESSKAPMKPNLIVMFLASTGSGNKTETKERGLFRKWSSSWRPRFKNGNSEAFETDFRSRQREMTTKVGAFMISKATEMDTVGCERYEGLKLTCLDYHVSK